MKTGRTRCLLVAALLVAGEVSNTTCAIAEDDTIAASKSTTIGKATVGYWAQGKRVIPLTYTVDGFHVTSVKLPDVVVKNDTTRTMLIDTIEITGRSGGRNMITVALAGEHVEKSIAEAHATVKRIEQRPQRAEVYALRYGRIALPKNVASGREVGIGETAIVALSGIIQLSYIGVADLDELLIVITGSGDQRLGELHIPLAEYRPKSDYLFPVKGSDLYVANLPTNPGSHRLCHSQEFAFDLVAMRSNETGRPMTHRGTGEALSDYFIFGRPVRAIGDGTVVAVAKGFPDQRNSNPKTYTEEAFNEALRELIPQIGLQNSLAGNFLVVDHGGGEFAFYAHLREGSIAKAIGDKVTKGEVIGVVGNTGHSTEPHLHLQLMDGPDHLSANSLPMAFASVPPTAISDTVSRISSLISLDGIFLPPQE